VDSFGASVAAGTAEFGKLIPLTGQFSGALGQLIASLSGGGGGGGFLGAVLGIAGTALGAIKGGGTAIDGGPMGASLPGVEAYLASLPGNARGGMAPTSGAFWLGENGRELARWTTQGLRIESNESVRRMESGGGGGFHNYQTINVPERADKRRTSRGIARDTQFAFSTSVRSGIARGPRRAGR
jgi:hypothetical protein